MRKIAQIEWSIKYWPDNFTPSFFYWFFYNRKWVDHHCQYPVLNWLKKSNKALKRAVIVHLIVQLIKMLMCDGSYLMNYKAFRYIVIFLHLICLIPYFLFFSKPTFKTASVRDCSNILLDVISCSYFDNNWIRKEFYF